jgi:ADP-heptose:LPS heptosyltransferase
MIDLPAPLRATIAAGGDGLSILVLRLGAMGDVVRTLPAVRLVRRGLPRAKILWVGWEPWMVLLRGHADLSGTIAISRAALRNRTRVFGELSSLRDRAREARPGLVLDFHGDFRTGLIGLVSGARVRLGYSGHQQKGGNRLFTTHRVPAGPRRRSRIERNLDLVRALGLPDGPLPDAGLPIGDADRKAAEDIARALSPQGAYAVLNPGASRTQQYKRPPAALFGAAARALVQAGVTPIVSSGPGEDADADRALRASEGLAKLAPATSLLELAALIAGARVFVGGDSGPLHIACGVGCPVVGLYGPTDPMVNTPWNVPFTALTRPGSTHTGIKSIDRKREGFDGLTVDEVAEAVRAQLSSSSSRNRISDASPS